MKEEFLHYVWKNKLVNATQLKTTTHQSLQILNFGLYNQNAGPDFLNSRIEIDDQVWFGNIELHVKSSDWYRHHHEVDANYDAVILHAVWEHDMNVYSKNNEPIPTLELKNYIEQNIVKSYYKLTCKNLNWIPCEKQIADVNSFFMNNWLERLFIERLEKRSEQIRELLFSTKNDWEATLFIMLAKNFGLRVNQDAFLVLAKSIPYSIIRKEQREVMKLSALFFGQAGFLDEEIEDSYYLSLKTEYAYLRHKYGLEPASKHQFQFFRMRPANFPTIRIAQLAALYSRQQNLFSRLMNLKDIRQFYMIFKVELAPFWETHYTFDKESRKSKKNLTSGFLDLTLINTIIPLKFYYLKTINQFDKTFLLDFLRELKPEKNSIISRFSMLGVQANNAFESQALLELKSNYCAPKRCLECAIGNQLVRKNTIS